MPSPRFVIGVDGGGTKTVALVGSTEGVILGRGEAGSSNYHNVGENEARRAIRQAVRDGQRRAGLMRKKAEVAVVALAAVDSRKDRIVAERFVRAAKIAKKSIIVHDSVAALEEAIHGDQGIVIISGTGCVAAGINSAGKYFRAGGWGYLIDDEGSAYHIGRRALMSAYRAVDGRSSSTSLVRVFERHLRVRKLEDALAKIYAKDFGVDDIAGLAPVVAKCAARDKISKQILNDAGTTLAELACTVAKRLKMENESFTIALVGGAFFAGKYLVNPLRRRVRKECPYARVRLLRTEPAKGALSLAASKIR